MSIEPIRPVENTYCAEKTRQTGDPLYGTGTQAQLWFLLEVRSPWPAKAVVNNDLPSQVQDFLSAQLASNPNSRLLFIKQQKLASPKLRFFVVKTAELAPAIFEFHLDTYQDLLALDMAAIVNDQETAHRLQREEPLFLVCTNGKRDKCCAKFGLPVYGALRQSEGDRTWQSSHIGGHRHAPTLLFLPNGLNLGLLTPEEAQAAAVAFRAGYLHDLSRYRGRTYYAPHVQASDYFLRQELQYHALSGIQLRSVMTITEDDWLVQFAVSGTTEIHQLQVQRQMTAQKHLVSCSSPAEKALPRYRLLEHSIL